MASDFFLKSDGDFSGRLQVICQALGINCTPKDLFVYSTSKGCKIDLRTFSSWLSDKSKPHRKKVVEFANKIDIDPEIFFVSHSEFCEYLSRKFNIDCEKLNTKYIEYTTNLEHSILGKVQSNITADTLSHKFENTYQGMWYVHHYWKKNPGDVVKGEVDEPELEEANSRQYVFTHLLNIYKYNRETNTMLANLASARQKKFTWNYSGHIIDTSTKSYYILQTVDNSDVEVILLVLFGPSKSDDFQRGILLASTAPKYSDGIISYPASCRVFLQKISNDNDDDINKYSENMGIYHDSFFKDKDDFDIGEISNDISEETGILFPFQPDFNSK